MLVELLPHVSQLVSKHGFNFLQWGEVHLDLAHRFQLGILSCDGVNL